MHRQQEILQSTQEPFKFVMSKLRNKIHKSKHTIDELPGVPKTLICIPNLPWLQQLFVDQSNWK